MAKTFNLARMTTATTGTGTITLGSAVSGHLTFALAGVQDGDIVSYGIKDGASSEVGTGTYTASGTTLTRTPTKSTSSDAVINLSGTAEVFITPRAEDLFGSQKPNYLPWKNGAGFGARTYTVTADGLPGSSVESGIMFFRDQTVGGNALVIYDGGGTPTIVSGSSNFTLTDPGSGGNKWFIKSGASRGDIQNRYGVSHDLSVILLGSSSGGSL